MFFAVFVQTLYSQKFALHQSLNLAKYEDEAQDYHERLFFFQRCRLRQREARRSSRRFIWRNGHLGASCQLQIIVSGGEIGTSERARNENQDCNRDKDRMGNNLQRHNHLHCRFQPLSFSFSYLSSSISCSQSSSVSSSLFRSWFTSRSLYLYTRASISTSFCLNISVSKSLSPSNRTNIFINTYLWTWGSCECFFFSSNITSWFLPLWIWESGMFTLCAWTNSCDFRWTWRTILSTSRHVWWTSDVGRTT